MEFLTNLGLATSVAVEPVNLALCLAGVLIGTLVGVLPGLGPTATISMLLPVTFALSPVQAVIMLSGIYYGAYYGGSITSILMNIPGEAASVVTCLDGYQMARKGRAGAALGISAIGSFLGATVSLVLMFLVAPKIAGIALSFGPPEFVSLAILGLTLVTYLSSGSMVKAFVMATLGVLLATIGLDTVTGRERFTGGFTALAGGLNIVPVAMGLFGVSEVLLNLERSSKTREVFEAQLKPLLPTREDWRRCAAPIARGSVLGFLLGIIPGGGGVLASFASYAVEKRTARDPSGFGFGDIRGVAGPETANNAAAQASFIPMLTMGIPTNAVMAVLLGSLTLHGVTMGPRIILEQPELFWGVLGSMYVGNVMLLVLNLPLVGLWVRLIKVPYQYLFPMILLFCMVGAYTVNNTAYDIYVMIAFGVAGYLLRKFQYEPAPLILAFVLAPILEDAFRQSLIISNGSPAIFITRPISLGFLAASALILLSPLILNKLGWNRVRELAAVSDDP